MREAPLDQLLRAAATPTGCARSRPRPRAPVARPGRAPAGSRAAPRPGRPSACSPSGRGRCRRWRAAGRSIRRSGPGTRRSPCPAPPRARARPSSIASAWSEMIAVAARAPRARPPAGRSRRAPPPARARAPRAGADRLHHPLGDRRTEVADLLACRRTQPGAAASQLSRLRRGGASGSDAHRQLPRSSLPERVRGSGVAAKRDPLRHLERGERRRRSAHEAHPASSRGPPRDARRRSR